MTLSERLRTSLAATADDVVPYFSDMLPTSVRPERSRGTATGGHVVSTSLDTDGHLIPAAVLIAITDRSEPGLILTQRPTTMRRHAGQVAFPGGRIDPGDADAVDAALREAEEEVELPREHVEIIDALTPYHTITSFEITPVIGVIPPDLPLVPHHREVEAVFEVPLAFLLDPANRSERQVMFEGVERRYFEILWNDRNIWGATAAMLANLSARLKW